MLQMREFLLAEGAMSLLARFSLPQYELMIETGVFDGEFHQRVELIRGEIRQMNPIGANHAAIVNFLARWSIQSVSAEKVTCSIQNPIRLPESNSSPEPDIAWLVPKRYPQHPLPNEVLLLIEVADKSLHLDCGEKAVLYAESGIPEYWVVDIEGRKLIVHRDPAGDGYGETVELAGEEVVCPLCDREARLTVKELFAKL
jgi:Uma2 family endonuclease